MKGFAGGLAMLMSGMALIGALNWVAPDQGQPNKESAIFFFLLFIGLAVLAYFLSREDAPEESDQKCLPDFEPEKKYSPGDRFILDGKEAVYFIIGGREGVWFDDVRRAL